MDKIAIGSDHAGFQLKREIIELLQSKELDYTDFGTFSENSCDYPEFGLKVAQAVASDEYTRGIVVCGTGVGISIAANKVSGIRAALCGDSFTAKMTRLHNDANILALGARVIGTGLALEIVETFLATSFEGGRHQRRLDIISDYENR